MRCHCCYCNVGEEAKAIARHGAHFFRAALERFHPLQLVLDGAGSDTIVAKAWAASFEVIVRGPGEHSWSDFGAPPHRRAGARH